MNKQERHFYEFGSFRLELDDRFLKRGSEPVEITPQAFELLLALVEKAGRVVSREELIQRLWPDTSVGENSLPQAVAALRRSLRPAGDGYVETVPKRGYRFLPRVQEVRDQVADPAQQEAGAPVGQPAPEVPVVKVPAPRIFPRVVAIGLVLSGILAFLYFLNFRRARKYPAKLAAPTPARALYARRTIAVIGIKSARGQSRESWTSTALSEILGAQLGAGGELRVLPQDTISQAKADLAIGNAGELAADSISRIRGILAADLVVFGFYHDSPGNSLRLEVRVEDAAGDQVAFVSESGPSNDLFDIASRVGASLRSTLRLQPSSHEELASIRASWPVGPQAAELYSRGLEFVHSLKMPEARDSFEKAIRAEPDFALSHMRLAEVWSVLGYEEKAKGEAQKAFDLAGTLTQEERLWVEGHYREMASEWEVAIAIYARLREFYPDEIDYALQLASAQVSGGKRNDGLNTLDRLLGMPLSEGDRARVDLAEAVACEADPPRALQAARRARSEGELQNARFLTARATLQESYALQDTGQLQEATETAIVAQRLFAAIGDQLGYARAVIHRGNLLHNGGTLDQRKVLYEEALNICRQVGNKRCESGALNNLAGVKEDEGDFPEAEKVYREALRVREEIGDRTGIALALNNLGTTQEMQGDLSAAQDSYIRAAVQYRAVGFKEGQGMALGNLAEVRRLRGNVSEARQLAQESVNLWEETGVGKSFRGGAVDTLADILFRQGDLDQAEKLYAESISIAERSGGRDSSVWPRTSLAALWMERGRLTDAERELRECRGIFRRGKDPGHEAVAEASLLKALLRDGNLREAEQEVPRALQLTIGASDKVDTLPLTIAVAQVQAAEGKMRAAEATLTKSLNWETAHGFVEYALEARLALGEIEKGPKALHGRSLLGRVRSEAQSRGYGLIADQASRALPTPAGQRQTR